ncbi:Suppressor protein STM1 [Spathaspora sp. JA1]|nr:Suppressor protein STM1 [Spathaspora sp. JA1]
MSFQNKNLYNVLGNDLEEDNATPALPSKVVVKQTTSSKKSDTVPASVDPAKAKKKSKPTGNEGAFKNKNENKEVSGPQSTPSKHTKKPFDRHSRTGKVDSKKKFKQGWGEDDKRVVEGEVEGTQDAVAELAEEASEEVAEPVVAQKSLQEYLAELEAQKGELEGAKKLRQANEGAEDKWVGEEKIEKQQEVFFESTTTKKSKSKAHKEKVFLDVEATFADEQPQQFKRDGARGGRGGSRGGARGDRRGGARGGARGGRGRSSPKPAAEVNSNNFPSL